MDHYNEALKLQQEMTDSSGSALKRYQDYAQSTEAHLNDLTNALQRMWMQILKSSDVNSAISAMTSLVNTISSVVTRLGTIPTVIGIGLPILLSFNKALYGTFSKEVITAVDTFIKDLRAIPAATAIAEAGVNLLTNSFKSLGIIVAGLAKELLPFLLLTGVSYAIGYIVDKINEARQAQAELDKQNNEIVSNYQKNSSTVDVLVKEYEDLSKKSGLSADEQQRLVDVQNQLNKLMPNLTDHVDEQGNAHLKNADMVEKEIEYTKQLLQLQNQQKVVSFDKNIESQFNNIAKLQRQISLLQNSINGYNKLPDSVKNQPMYLEAYIKDERNLLIAQQQLKDAFDKVASSIKDNANTYIQLHDIKNVLTETDKKYIETQIEENTANIKNAEQGKEYYNTLKTQIDGMINARDELSKLTGSQQNDNAVKTQAIAILEKYGFTASQAASLIEEMTNKTNVLINTAHNEESGITLLNDAVNKLSNGYSLSQDEIDKLVAKYPDLANALTEENGLTNINIQALEEKQKAEIDSANATIKSLEAEVEKQKEALAAKLPMYASEIEAIKNVATARQIAAGIQQKESEDLQKRLEASQPTWEKYANKSLNNAIADVLSSTNNTNSYASQLIQLGQLEEEIKSLNSAISNVGVSSTSPISPSSSGYFPSGSSSSKSKGSSGSTSTKTVEPYVIDEYSHQMAELDLQLQESKNRLDQLDKSSQDYTNELNAQNIIIQKEIDLTKNRINGLNASNDALLKQINALQQNKKLNADQQEQLNNLLKTYDDNRNSIEQLEGKIIDLNSALQQNITTVQQAWLDNAKNIASQVVDAYKAALQEEETLALKAKDDELKAEEQRHQTVMNSLDGELQKYQDVINAKLKLIDAESAQHDYEEQLADLQQQQSDIQKQINVLSLDDSVEAQAKLADLKQQYADTSKKIDDLRYKNETDLRKQNLQDQLDAYQKDIQAKKDAENQIYQANQDEINREKELIQAHYNDLLNDTQNFTNMQQQIIEGKGSEILNTLTNYINTFNSLMKDSINQNGEDLLGLLGLIQQLQSAQTGLSSLGSPPSILSNGLTVNSGNGTSQTKNAIAVLSPSQYQLDSTGSAIMPSRTLGSILGVGVEWDANTGMVKIGGKLFIPSKIDSSGTSYVPIRVVAAALGHQVEYSNGKISIFDTGGYTGEFSGGKLAILHEKELVLNKDDTANLLKTINFNNNFIKYLEGLQLPSLNTSNNNSNNVNVNVYIGKVTGDEEGAQTLITSFINGLKKKGLRLA